MEDSPALGAPLVGSLTDVVAEGTLLNMVLRRMHRPRSCSYQLLLEHQRPSRIQGLRWVSANCLSRPGTRAGGGPGLGAWAYCSWPSLLWGSRGYCRVDSVGQAAWLQCVGVAHTAVPSVSVCVWCPSAPFQNWREEARDLSFIHHLSVPWVRCLCALQVGVRVMHEILEAKSSGGEVSLIAVLDTSPWQRSY